MQSNIISKPEFYVVGISVKTTPEQASQDLFTLWQKFITTNVQQQIPNRLSSDVYALYTDYEGDYTKPYTCVIGCQVSVIDDLPSFMVARKIPSAKYLTFCAKGIYPESVIKTWNEIWQSDLLRAYQTDFELYNPNFFQTQLQDTACPVNKDKEVTIYVGIK